MNPLSQNNLTMNYFLINPLFSRNTGFSGPRDPFQFQKRSAWAQALGPGGLGSKIWSLQT